MRKELYFGFIIMAAIVVGTLIAMPSFSEMTNGHLGLLMLSLVVVAIKSQLSIPNQVFEFISIYLLLAIGIKGGVALYGVPVGEIGLPILLSVALGILIPLVVFFTLKYLTPLNRVNRGALAAHYGSTSLVTFTAGLVFIEQAKMTFEGYLPALLAVMEVPGIIVGILLAKRMAGKAPIDPNKKYLSHTLAEWACGLKYEHLSAKAA